jgi:hypothetical protein
MVRRLLPALAACLFLIPTAWSAEFNASVDRTQLKAHEPLLFTLTLINSDTRLRAQGVDPNVDLTVLGDNFDLGRPKASTNYNIYRGQGRSTSELKVELFPKRNGRFTIPAFAIDGLHTKPIRIEVLKKKTALPDEVFIRSGTNVKAPWVNQQVVAYVDLYHRVALKSASLGSNLETEPVKIDMLSNWKLPEKTRHETIDGLDYEVERTAWSIFPNQAGAFKIELPDVWVATQAGNKLRLSQQTLEYKVRALPDGVPADIIIGKPQLTAQPFPNSFTQYELSEWTLTLRAPVGVTELPRLLPGIALPSALKLFPDPARYHTEQANGGIMDAADYTLSIMPLAAGEFELPAIRIPYFNPQLGKAALVEVPGRKIHVTASDLPIPTSNITDNSGNETAAADNASSMRMGPWQISTVVLALLWLATLYLWHRRPTQNDSEPKAEATAITTPKDERQPLQQQLLAAMRSRTLEQGLQRWLEQHPNDRVVLDAVRAVQRLYYGHGSQTEAEVAMQVGEAVALIKQTPNQVDTNQPDPWQAESFSPGRRQ